MAIDFQQLVSDPVRLRDLLDNCSFGGNFDGWTRRKKFIADVIHKDGSILDIGCGNGFLIRCLQEWSDYQLTPYGIDTNGQYIKKAKDLFPEHTGNFVVLDLKNLDLLKQHALPDRYDYVLLSNRWTKESAANAQPVFEELFNNIKEGGRLVVGFYDEDAKKNRLMFNLMKSAGVTWSGRQDNPFGTNLIGWIEKV